MYFQYSNQATDYLTAKDPILGQVIERIGWIEREVNPNLFSALVNAIVGQQISTQAQKTVWRKLCSQVGAITPENILTHTDADLRAVGLSARKVAYIQNLAQKVAEGEVNLNTLHTLDDEAVCRCLMSLNGIGRWTAEMMLLFSLQRMDILSRGDFAIQKGLCLLYHHRKITTPLYEKYRRRYRPYGSVASLYLWEVANCATKDKKEL